MRQLAAVDMWGETGDPRRRRLIRISFTTGAASCLILGMLAFVESTNGLWTFIGAWLIGAGLNYLPLALYAQSLSQPGALEYELEGVPDLARELRLTRFRQLWIAVPLSVAIAAVTNERNGYRW